MQLTQAENAERQVDGQQRSVFKKYYPIKMDASKSQNYLQSTPGMMDGMKGFLSPECIHL